LKLRILTAAAVSAFMLAGPALAQDENAISLEGEIGVVSDYRYRGYSLSDEDAAIQGGLTLNLPHGVYAGVWASNIADYAGADIEVDLSAGVAFSGGGLDWDVGVIRYAYPGGTDVDYWEIPVSASKTWGAFTGTASFQYVPEQDNVSEENRYFNLAGDWAPEHWPVSVNASFGYEDGAFADGKLDWSAGVAKAFGPVTVSLTWADSDGPGAEGVVVGGISAAF
jgi:uncharacterized protein (TIGR02001 family)